MIKILGLIVTIVLAAIPNAYAAGRTPVATISQLYASYGQGCNHSDSVGLNEELAQRLFDAGLFRTYRNAGWIDADFFIGGQDWCFTKPVSVTLLTQTRSKARVLAIVSLDDSFRHGAPRPRVLKITFHLVRSPDGWRIADALEGGESVKNDWRRR